MNPGTRTAIVLMGLAAVFLLLAAGFLFDMGRRPAEMPSIPLVDPMFIDKATVRIAYPDLVKAKADLSDFDCYVCHEKGKPPILRFDTNNNLIVPKEHA